MTVSILRTIAQRSSVLLLQQLTLLNLQNSAMAPEPHWVHSLPPPVGPAKELGAVLDSFLELLNLPIYLAGFSKTVFDKANCNPF